MLLLSCSEQTAQELFNQTTNQEPVLTHDHIDSVYASFEKISYQDLPEYYREYSDPNDDHYTKLKSKDYLVLHGDGIYTYMVGKFPLDNFLTTDFYYSENKEDLSKNQTLYCLLSKDLLHLILDFMLELEEKGYDKYGFLVREAHRHPFYNYVKGGASRSQHIYGTAADLTIEDINEDGIISDIDKDIAIEILEDLIGNKGGMGVYPGTRTIHVDTRGHRARW